MRRVGCGGGRVALWDWFNVGNLVSKEGAVAEAVGRRKGERAPAPSLGEGLRQEPATPKVYVEACSIVWSLLGVAARSRVIPGGDAEVGGLLDCSSQTSTPPVV